MADKFEMNLKWIGSKHHANRTGNDVSINVCEYSSTNKNVVSFTIRNGIFNLFTNSEHMFVAIFKNRIYFREADKRNGLKLCTNKNNVSDNRYAKLYNPTDFDRFRRFVGDYEIKHDEFYDLYYIEREDMNFEDTNK